MFFLYRFLMALPLAYLKLMGTPFKWDNDGSNLHRLSEKELKKRYFDAKSGHYIPRVFASVMMSFVLFFVLLLLFTFPAVLLWIAIVVGAAVLIVDGTLALGRFVVYQEKVEEAKRTGTDLVRIDDWKDTSLQKVLEERLGPNSL